MTQVTFMEQLEGWNGDAKLYGYGIRRLHVCATNGTTEVVPSNSKGVPLSYKPLAAVKGHDHAAALRAAGFEVA